MRAVVKSWGTGDRGAGESAGRQRIRAVAAILYIGVTLGVIALVDGGVSEAGFIWSVVSFVLGWITRWPWMALLPLLASPMAVPFGYAAEWSGHDALPLWFGFLIGGVWEGVIVLAGLGGRRLYERSRWSRG